jgi:GNAT superfamily N-acetyltransferase|tara:strand:+ start:171 stop:608 length:438 start_codon:yes stop_codon:yes gene_type:complete
MRIRRAEQTDVSELYDMLTDMHSQTVLPVSPMKKDKVMNMIILAITRGVVYVATEKNKILGSIGGMSTSDWWSTDEYLGDLWFYVFPEHRKSNIAIKLVKTFINYGKEVKLKIKLGSVYSGDLRRKDNFFNRLGFVKAGSLYLET